MPTDDSELNLIRVKPLKLPHPSASTGSITHGTTSESESRMPGRCLSEFIRDRSVAAAIHVSRALAKTPDAMRSGLDKFIAGGYARV